MVESGATAGLSLTVSGDESGTISVVLPCERTEDDGWLRVRRESADLLAVGSTGLAELSLAVPEFHGTGRYDLAEPPAAARPVRSRPSTPSRCTSTRTARQTT